MADDDALTQRGHEHWHTAGQEAGSEGRSRATQLMPMSDGPGSASPAFPTRGEDATASSSQAPWLRTTLLPGDNISETRDPAETYIALKRLLRMAEHEGGNSHAAPESSRKISGRVLALALPR